MSPVPSPTQDNLADLAPRQIWAAESSFPSLQPNQCITYTVQGPGFFSANSTFFFNFTDDAILTECGINAIYPLNSTVGDNDIFGPDDPYFASISPVLFVLGVCLTVAWILLMMLLMTPRTYLTGIGSSRRRPDAGINVVGVGSRPWFQKVAALFVAIALVIATNKTFVSAETQYNQHYQDSQFLTKTVLNSPEIRSIRFVSTLFEWLAQAQTALRLFPRHRERIAIKWIALTLILLEMIFGIINGFTPLGQDDDGFFSYRPRQYAYAFPALQYLFELALSLMYAGVIAYYSMTKRRFAFYHPDMWNITLVALLSITAVLVPVVFFVLDIAVADISAWGDYVRWVGAAAASVVVWEWVERIEALEREERKDGILGREIFEGDDFLGGQTSGRERRSRRRRDGGDKPDTTSPTLADSATNSSRSSTLKKASATTAARYKRVSKGVLRKVAALRTIAKAKDKPPGNASKDVELQPVTGAVRRRKQRTRPADGSRPPALDPTVAAQTSASPVSRSDCTSASTVYRVVHHAISPSSTPGISETLGQNMNIVSPVVSPVQEEVNQDTGNHAPQRRSFVESVLPFRRRSSTQTHDIPPEIIAQQAQTQASAEAASGWRGKGILGRGLFSRFRFGSTEEKELPELIVPWRGPATFPQQDLESGNDGQRESHDDSRTEGQRSQRDDSASDTYINPNGQVVSHSGNVTFYEEPEYANRGSSRPINSAPHDNLPP